MKSYESYKAARLTSQSADVEPLRLSFLAEPPRYIGPESEWRPRLTEIYTTEGCRIERLLRDHLPGGLYDGILRAMLENSASVLRVPFGGDA